MAIYVKDTLRFTVNNTVRADVNSRVNLGRYFKWKRKLILGVQYRPPNLRREDTSSLLQEINRACRNKNV